MIAFVAANLLKNLVKWPVGNGFMIELLIRHRTIKKALERQRPDAGEASGLWQ
jgi:hypothetical protein